jgi:general secretion pathway protein G
MCIQSRRVRRSTGQSTRIGSRTGFALKTLLQIRSGGPSLRKRRSRLLGAGFTLIELMIVVAIMLILISMAVVSYGKFIQRSKEAVLMYDLRTMREMIDHYTADKEAAPQSVEDLSHAGYLREVPVDPMTRTKEWAPKYDIVFLGREQANTGVVDVSSKSTGTALDGTKYSEW